MKFVLQKITNCVNGLFIDYRLLDNNGDLVERVQNQKVNSNKIKDIIYECEKNVEQEMLNEYTNKTSKISCEQDEIERN